MKRTAHVVKYWDTSAIVSVLFSDEHRASAITFARAKGTHIMSSLAWSEAHAVIPRIERERTCATVLVDPHARRSKAAHGAAYISTPIGRASCDSLLRGLCVEPICGTSRPRSTFRWKFRKSRFFRTITG